MYSFLMNQNFTLKTTNGTDENGDIAVEEVFENVACLITYKNKLIVTANGKELTSSGTILTNQKAKVGDLAVVNGVEYPIIMQAPLYGYDNDLNGYLLYF